MDEDQIIQIGLEMDKESQSLSYWMDIQKKYF